MEWKKLIIIVGAVIAILFGLVFIFFCVVLFFQKHTVLLVSHGKTIAIAKQPFLKPWGDGQMDVYAGKTKVFSLWEDAFDGPVFIYPFADGKRFLCDFDDDTAMLDFIVDLRTTGTNDLDQLTWPPDGYVRNYIASRATNVVFNTKGFARLPSYGELQEVSSYLTSGTSEKIYANCFRVFGNRNSILLDLATNRQSAWLISK